ncbi:hypothetical protein PCANC_13572 [Puccinia coronata f. sp. avenae]|uniref:Uncharacterized protein n=1 Tax=Puccinia coronata f. sp. avenae TaxID=200324 RepID=A0A2N5UCP9_9BASI|nr:hypothetical protein PCANC_20848 [Puccinia coronata f. sp. avenae]PLW35158.1 hypothetical protein PCASD_11247 [Puccinia coronata f. sp. avenae]PLW35504.1 hypothetical protein PCANC_13572 [Puccinia coronata f. sp. avenae]
MLSSAWIFGAVLILTLQQSPALADAGNHQDKSAHLQGRYRIVGQPPPPCKDKICPLTVRSQPEDTTYNLSELNNGGTSSEKQQHSGEPNLESNKPHFIKTAPITCHDGTHPPCQQDQPVAKNPGTYQTVGGSASHNPGTHQTAPINCGDGTKPPCGKEGEKPAHFPGTHQTAPIKCGDGTKPPCGKGGEKPPSHFPGTHQTAPINCGDGTKPPCGKGGEKPPSYIPGTHQTAPMACGDGTKPPCGQTKPAPAPATATGYDSEEDCGDDTPGPCVITQPGPEPPHPDLLPPSSDYKQSTQSPRFTHRPPTHQTAPVSCGDGTKPPCHSSSGSGDALYGSS